MADSKPIASSMWTITRLPDRHPDSPATQRRYSIDDEASGWEYLAEYLPTGWCATPPWYIGRRCEWVCVAFNVRGCLKRSSIVVGVGADRLTALDALAVQFEFQSDADCVRAQRRQPN